MSWVWLIKFKAVLGRNLREEDLTILKKATAARLGGESESQAEVNRATAEKVRAEAELLRAQTLETLVKTLRTAGTSVVIVNDDYIGVSRPDFMEIRPIGPGGPEGLYAELGSVYESVHRVAIHSGEIDTGGGPAERGPLGMC